jgi:hypothetical protein
VLILLADANINGHVRRLAKRMQGEPWADFWSHLQLSYASFADVGLDAADTDAVVWQTCQDKRLLLITGNRNDDGPDSLQNTIRARSGPHCLPVFTIANADRVLVDGDYAAEVIWRLYEYLFDLDGLLGTGRLYIP